MLLGLMDGRRIEIEARLVDATTNLTMSLKQLTRTLGVALTYRGVELLQRRLREGLDLAFQRSPGIEAVATGDYELGVVKFQERRISVLWKQSAHPLQRRRFARPDIAQQLLRELTLLFEI